MKRPAAAVTKRPATKRPATKTVKTDNDIKMSKDALELGGSKDVQEAIPMNQMVTSSPGTPPVVGTRDMATGGTPQKSPSREAVALAPEGYLLEWDSFSSERKLAILTSLAESDPPAWLPPCL